jgi:hypothetical protein
MMNEVNSRQHSATGQKLVEIYMTTLLLIVTPEQQSDKLLLLSMHINLKSYQSECEE